ncbi:hypothetical protein, partial [Devosia lacusdianchii]|uniref:hypothetical protein n=1 Tax=Devosia lacusdianchii TaxID=2917991 RepID=UPI001F05384D
FCLVRRKPPRGAGFGTILGDRGVGTLAPAGQYLNLRGSEAGTCNATFQTAQSEDIRDQAGFTGITAEKGNKTGPKRD